MCRDPTVRQVHQARKVFRVFRGRMELQGPQVSQDLLARLAPRGLTVPQALQVRVGPRVTPARQAVMAPLVLRVL